MIRLATMMAAKDWQVLHLAGIADADLVREAYTASNVPAVVLTFTDRMAQAMLLADLIISAGASSLAEILAVGRASILLPYPYHRDQHQRHNGGVLVEAGAAVMIEDRKESIATTRELEPVLEGLLHNDERREYMDRAGLCSAARKPPSRSHRSCSRPRNKPETHRTTRDRSSARRDERRKRSLVNRRYQHDAQWLRRASCTRSRLVLVMSALSVLMNMLSVIRNPLAMIHNPLKHSRGV